MSPSSVRTGKPSTKAGSTTSLVFSTAGIVLVGGIALVTLSRAFLAAKMEKDAKLELESGPPRHMLADFHSSLPSGEHEATEVNPTDSSLLLDVVSAGHSSSSASGDGLGSGLSETERFLDTMRFQDGGRKYIQRIVGAATSSSHTASGDDSHGDGSGSGSSSGDFGRVHGDDFGDDDRAFSLWARDIDKMKVAWAKGYGLEVNPSAQRPNPKPKDLRANEQGRNNNNNNGGANSKGSDTAGGNKGSSRSSSGSSNKKSVVSNPSGLSAFEQPQVGTAGSWSSEEVESAVAQDATVATGASSSSSSSSSSKSSSFSSSSSSSSSSNGRSAPAQPLWSDDLEAKERLQWGPDRTHALGVEARIAAESAEAQKLATMLGRNSGGGVAAYSPSSGGDGKNGGGGQWARPEGGLRPQGRGKSGAGLTSSSSSFGDVSSLPELNMLPVARQHQQHGQLQYSSSSSSSSIDGALFFAPETTHAGTSTKGRALPKGSGKALVGGGSAAASYFSEELPTLKLDPAIEGVLAHAGSMTLAKHAIGWFVPRLLPSSNSTAQSARRAPAKGRNVVFIKVAKAGGTTLQEILGRYATERHLIVASPEHVKKSTSFHRGKANILSRHCTLPNFLELKFIAKPYIMITVLRDPLSLAVSMFYWKHQEKRASPYKYMRRFRQEDPGSFSDRHRAHIHVFAAQNEELRAKLPDYSIYGYLPQYLWFGDTVVNAVKELVMREFLVGLVHKFDHLLVMLKYRLEVDLRSLIGVTTNHYRHPRAASWPSVSLQLLNTTGKLQADWKFFRAAERIYNQQVREFGSSKLRKEVKVYQKLMANLRRECDPDGKEFRAAERFLPRCKPGQGTCVFDAEECVKCMLKKEESCTTGSAAGNGFCEREVVTAVNAEEEDGKQK